MTAPDLFLILSAIAPESKSVTSTNSPDHNCCDTIKLIKIINESRMFQTYFGPFRLKMFKFDAGGRVVDTFYKFVGNSLAEIVP